MTLSLALISSVSAAAFSSEILAHCESPRIVDTTYAGKDKNVKVDTYHCDSIPTRRDIEKRQTNVCGAECRYSCLLFTF